MFFYYSVKNNYLQGLYIILFIGAFIYICMSLDFLRYFIMVPEVGLEPTQGCPYQILSLGSIQITTNYNFL